MRIDFPEWLPDLPDLGNPGATVVRNVLPRSGGSYGAFRSLMAFSDPIGATCRLIHPAVDRDGNPLNFACADSRIYVLTLGLTSWTDISRSTGYTTAPEDGWSAAGYGKRIVFSNFADPIQSYVIGTDSICQPLSASAPRARHMAVIRDWLVVANTYDPIDGAVPQRVWWSGIDDPTSWPAPGSDDAIAKQSDYQDLVDAGGSIQGVVGNLGPADGAIFLERSIQRMTYVGPPAIFSFQQVEGARGTPAPRSIVQLGSIVFYLGEDGFYQFDGSSSVPIGAGRVDKAVFTDLDQSHLHRIVGAVDPINKIVFWAYPASGNQNGDPNRLLAYNWSVVNADGSSGRWSLINLECETIGQSISSANSLDTLDRTGFTLDTLPFSLDSRYWSGGRPLLAAFDRQHRLAHFTGPTLAPTIETGEVEMTPGGRSLVETVRPLVDGGTPSVAIGIRDRQIDPVAYQNPVVLNERGETPQRALARYHRFRLTLPAGSDFTHLQGLDIGVRKGDRR